MELDHVIVAVSDLDDAASALLSRDGLATVAGGRHPDWGTMNRIVPCGSSYLELVAVADERSAATSAFGRWVAGSPEGPLGWVARTQALDAVAARLELEIVSGSRNTPDGGVLHWRAAGVGEAAAEPCLPFFIEWEPGAPFPGSSAVDHPAGPVRVVRVELEGDAERLVRWLDGTRLPIVVREGAPRVARVVLEASDRTLVLDGAVVR